jgi:hypothetical protein
MELRGHIDAYDPEVFLGRISKNACKISIKSDKNRLFGFCLLGNY